jgi:hypothetical protein
MVRRHESKQALLDDALRSVWIAIFCAYVIAVVGAVIGVVSLSLLYTKYVPRDGSPGVAGANGADGPTGPPGMNGTRGPPGPTGANGTMNYDYVSPYDGSHGVYSDFVIVAKDLHAIIRATDAIDDYTTGAFPYIDINVNDSSMALIASVTSMMLTSIGVDIRNRWTLNWFLFDAGGLHLSAAVDGTISSDVLLVDGYTSNTILTSPATTIVSANAGASVGLTVTPDTTTLAAAGNTGVTVTADTTTISSAGSTGVTVTAGATTISANGTSPLKVTANHVGIGTTSTPAPYVALEVSSNLGVFLLPHYSISSRGLLPSNLPIGSMVFDTVLLRPCVYISTGTWSCWTGDYL